MGLFSTDKEGENESSEEKKFLTEKGEDYLFSRC